jgi:hypothetical protein
MRRKGAEADKPDRNLSGLSFYGGQRVCPLCAASQTGCDPHRWSFADGSRTHGADPRARSARGNRVASGARHLTLRSTWSRQASPFGSRGLLPNPSLSYHRKQGVTLLSSIFRMAMREKVATANPCDELPKSVEQKYRPGVDEIVGFLKLRSQRFSKSAS